jgi:valyl-tRNA synthetase
VWSWWHEGGSIHRAPWPTVAEIGAGDGVPEVWTAASELLGDIRKVKTERGVSLRAQVASIRVRATPERLSLLQPAADDLREAANAIPAIEWVVVSSQADAGVEVELA